MWINGVGGYHDTACACIYIYIYIYLYIYICMVLHGQSIKLWPWANLLQVFCSSLSLTQAHTCTCIYIYREREKVWLSY